MGEACRNETSSITYIDRSIILKLIVDTFGSDKGKVTG